MVTPPIDWRGFQKNWVWPVGYTTAAASAIPLVYLILELPEYWLDMAIFIVTYAAAHVVFIGLPATMILLKWRRETFWAYCVVGLIAIWVMPICFYLKERAYLQSISSLEKLDQGLEHSDIMMLFFGVIGTPLSIIATAICWHYNRRPKLMAVGIIPPPRGYVGRLW